MDGGRESFNLVAQIREWAALVGRNNWREKRPGWCYSLILLNDEGRCDKGARCNDVTRYQVSTTTARYPHDLIATACLMLSTTAMPVIDTAWPHDLPIRHTVPTSYTPRITHPYTPRIQFHTPAYTLSIQLHPHSVRLLSLIIEIESQILVIGMKWRMTQRQSPELAWSSSWFSWARPSFCWSWSSYGRSNSFVRSRSYWFRTTIDNRDQLWDWSTEALG